MQCQESKKILDAYADNEVDVLQSAALEEHLAGCADCERILEERQALRTAIQNADLRYTAPPELVTAVRKSLRFPEEKKLSFDWFRLKHLGLGFAAATVVFLLVAGIMGFWFHVPEDQKIAKAATDDYIRSLLAENHGIDVVSSNNHTVKPWFSSSGRISFSPPVTDFTDKGFPLAGGRVDFVDNRPVATLIYKHDPHFINVFVYPEADHTYEGERQERGYQVLYWAKDGMQYWVVSDLNLTEMRQLAGLLGR